MIIKFIKDEIKMLKHLNKGGTCYIYFNSIINNDLLKLYLDLCKNLKRLIFLYLNIEMNIQYMEDYG